MSTTLSPRTEYLERLRDLLPYRDGPRILSEVDGLIQDRLDAEPSDSPRDTGEAERRAVLALGPAEQLAADLMAPPIQVDLGTRRAFRRLLAVIFAVHLLLSLVLTVAGVSSKVIPGLLGPLPQGSLLALVPALLSIFLVDVGALFLLFALLGRGKPPPQLPTLRLRAPTTTREAWLGLILLALVLVIVHGLRDQVFAVRAGNQLVGILAPEVLAVLPLLDVALALFALRQVAILRVGPDHAGTIGFDALASLALVAVLVWAAGAGDVVRIPPETLGTAAASALTRLTTRVLLLIFVVGALFLTVRFVKRVLRLRQVLA